MGIDLRLGGEGGTAGPCPDHHPLDALVLVGMQ